MLRVYSDRGFLMRFLYPRQSGPLAKRVGRQNARRRAAPQAERYAQCPTPPLDEGQIEVHHVPPHNDVRVLRRHVRQKRAQHRRFVGEETHRCGVGFVADHEDHVRDAAAGNAVDGAASNVGLDVN
jgi:hypothetical protein